MEEMKSGMRRSWRVGPRRAEVTVALFSPLTRQRWAEVICDPATLKPPRGSPALA
jgi:hypothetical protein